MNLTMINRGNRKYEDVIYSNFDHCFSNDEGYVKAHPDIYFQHSARDFCGYVWYDIETKKFYEEVWVYRSHIKTIKEETLKDLITNINNEFGHN